MHDWLVTREAKQVVPVARARVVGLSGMYVVYPVCYGAFDRRDRSRAPGDWGGFCLLFWNGLDPRFISLHTTTS